MLVTKLSPEDLAAVSAAATAAALASTTDVKYGHAPACRPGDEDASEVLVGAVSSHGTLPGPGNDGQRFAHLQSIMPIIHADIGREACSRGMIAFWRTMTNEPQAFPPECGPLFLQTSVTALGGRRLAGLHGHYTEEAHRRRG